MAVGETSADGDQGRFGRPHALMARGSVMDISEDRRRMVSTIRRYRPRELDCREAMLVAEYSIKLAKYSRNDSWSGTCLAVSGCFEPRAPGFSSGAFDNPALLLNGLEDQPLRYLGVTFALEQPQRSPLLPKADHWKPKIRIPCLVVLPAIDGNKDAREIFWVIPNQYLLPRL